MLALLLIRGFYVNGTYRLGPVDRLGGLVVIAPARRPGLESWSRREFLLLNY